MSVSLSLYYMYLPRGDGEQTSALLGVRLIFT